MATLTSLLLGVALVHGAPLVAVALLGLAVVRPELAALVAIVLSAVPRLRSDGDDISRQRAVALAAIATELRSGATLRMAIADAAARTPALPLAGVVHRAERGTATTDLAGELAAALKGDDEFLIAAAVRIGHDAGGRTADVFERLALRTQRRIELDEELVAATSQVRMSVRILVALPVLLGLGLALTGRLGAVVGSGPIGLGVLVAGASLQLVGVGVVLALTRRVLP